MTKIHCSNENIWHVCKYLKSGICTKDEIELEYIMESPEATHGHYACVSEDFIEKR
jgi:hypothetical protein